MISRTEDFWSCPSITRIATLSLLALFNNSYLLTHGPMCVREMAAQRKYQFQCRRLLGIRGEATFIKRDRDNSILVPDGQGIPKRIQTPKVGAIVFYNYYWERLET